MYIIFNIVNFSESNNNASKKCLIKMTNINCNLKKVFGSSLYLHTSSFAILLFAAGESL